MGVIAWIILGALAGWIASLITGRGERMGCIANIVAGIVGALIGGFVMNFLGRTGITGFNLQSLLVAVLGAVVLLLITGWWSRR
jgi:uncharacterized membrane protein YeaQ/YmgE (transglycosylase-associated protein family)